MLKIGPNGDGKSAVVTPDGRIRNNDKKKPPVECNHGYCYGENVIMDIVMMIMLSWLLL